MIARNCYACKVKTPSRTHRGSPGGRVQVPAGASSCLFACCQLDWTAPQRDRETAVIVRRETGEQVSSLEFAAARRVLPWVRRHSTAVLHAWQLCPETID